MNMLFADILKKLREEKGLSQNEIAKRIYVTAPQYPGGKTATVCRTPR